MATITAISASTSCDNFGGCTHAYATDYANVSGVSTNASGVITAFGMTGSGQWAKLEFDDNDNVAFFNEEGELVNNTRVQYNGTGLMKFDNNSAAKSLAAEKAAACCGVVIIWVQRDGTRRVQGVDVHPTTFAKTDPILKARIVPNNLSDTGENANRIEYNVQHTGKYLSKTTTLDDAAIEAL